jgi:hypothetical protein
MIETEHARQIAEMGIVGRLLGSRDNAVIYLAFIVILLGGIGAVVVGANNWGTDLVKGLLGLAISALGFMLGAGAAHRRDGHG